MTNDIDLWPENLAPARVNSPITILRSQASKLGKRTHNIVTAEVGVLTLASSRQQAGKGFVANFYIVAPALDNYKFKLFSIQNDISLYPVTFDLDEELYFQLLSIIRADASKNDVIYISSPALKEISVPDEDNFLYVLRFIFNAERTIRIIGAIMAQSVTEIEDAEDIPL